MHKSISVVIQEMKNHRDDFLKKSAPYRQLNRAIKQLEKLQQIEQIIEEHDNDSMPEDYWYIDRIREVLKDNKDET